MCAALIRAWKIHLTGMIIFKECTLDAFTFDPLIDPNDEAKFVMIMISAKPYAVDVKGVRMIYVCEAF